jgi:hypothetical protein
VAEEILRIGNGKCKARVFTFVELSKATSGFSTESLVGEGGFGRVYKGYMELEGKTQVNTYSSLFV